MSRMPSAARGAARRIRSSVRARLRPAGGKELTAAARRTGWTEPATGRLLRDLEAALAHGPRPARLAVLTRPGSPDWAGLVRTVFPRALVVCLEPDDPQLHARLAALGRYHAVLDDTLLGAERLPDLEHVFLHLRVGGVLLVRRPPGERSSAWAGLESAVRTREDHPDPKRNRGRGWKALPGAVESLSVGPRHVVVRNRRRALAKLHEHELDVVLADRPQPDAVVLQRLPATELQARCRLEENVPLRDEKMPERYSVPPMSVRVYDDVLCAPRQVAVQRNLLLPDSFRFNAQPVLRNHFAPDLGPRFTVPVGRAGAAPRLEGAYFYFASEWTNHFGHAVTEQLSRLWGVRAAREHAPDLKVLLDRRNGRTDVAPFELEILQAVGFSREDVVLHHRPVRVEHLVAASPMWVLPDHVHPDLGDLWREVGEQIAARASASAPDWPRIFISRRRDRRGCLNRTEVEATFSAHGFQVVYPEDMPFPDQVKMFRSAEVIAGFSGSGMFNMQFCPTPRHVIVLTPTSYPSRNEYMISAVLGHQLEYVWSSPDPEQLKGPQPRYAGFTFDFADEGVFLERVLGAL